MSVFRALLPASILLVGSTAAFGQSGGIPSSLVAPRSPITFSSEGLVSVDAVASPLEPLLLAFREACAIDLRIDPSLVSRPITIQLRQVAPVAAVAAILQESGVNHAMTTTCGTPEHPMRVVVGEIAMAGNIWKSSDPDDPARKAAAVEMKPASAGPPPEPEVRDPNASVAPGPEERSAPAEGQVTGAQMLKLLSAPPGPKPSMIVLPFTDQHGEPVLQVRPQGPRTVATLPFPDADGQPIQVPIPSGPLPATINVPLSKPVVPGKQPAPASPNPADAPRPNGGAS